MIRFKFKSKVSNECSSCSIANLSVIITTLGNDSVSYFSSQYDQAYNQALAKAIELSKEKGEALAAASGKKLGGVLNITEMSDNQQGRYVNADLRATNESVKMMAAGDSAAMDVMPGEMQVTAEIMVEFQLADAE